MKYTESDNRTAKIHMITSMVIFGTIGLFRKLLPFPSGMIAMVRGLVGMVFLLGLMTYRKKPIEIKKLKKSALLLGLSGGIMGINWLLLFEAYRYTSVAVATLCYYMAPIFVILVSPILLKEKLTGKKCACIAAAFGGMVLVSGVTESGFAGGEEFKGVLFGVAAAFLYASVVLMNKKITGVPSEDRTVIQLGAAGGIVLPYVLLAEKIEASMFTPVTILVLLFVGIVHTGVAYAMYFGALGKVKVQTAAIYSYIDPIVAILVSAIILQEGMNPLEMVGAVFILLSAYLCEKSE